MSVMGVGEEPAAYLAILRTQKISPGEQPMMVVSGTLASAPTHQRHPNAFKGEHTSNPQDLRSLSREMSREELPISLRYATYIDVSHLDPCPTSALTMPCSSRKARSTSQRKSGQMGEGWGRTISGYARDDPRGVGIGSVIVVSLDCSGRK